MIRLHAVPILLLARIHAHKQEHALDVLIDEHAIHKRRLAVVVKVDRGISRVLAHLVKGLQRVNVSKNPVRDTSSYRHSPSDHIIDPRLWHAAIVDLRPGSVYNQQRKAPATHRLDERTAPPRIGSVIGVGLAGSDIVRYESRHVHIQASQCGLINNISA